jgi:hypothetical protein
MAPRFRFRKIADASYRWILLGGNNRLIGAAVDGTRTMDEAVVAAERVRAIAADGAEFGFIVGEDRQWYWRLADEGVPLATSASGFDRRLDAQRAARRFGRAASSAQVQLGIVTVPDRVRERPGPSRDPRFPTRLNGTA